MLGAEPEDEAGIGIGMRLVEIDIVASFAGAGWSHDMRTFVVVLYAAAGDVVVGVADVDSIHLISCCLYQEFCHVSIAVHLVPTFLSRSSSCSGGG